MEHKSVSETEEMQSRQGNRMETQTTFSVHEDSTVSDDAKHKNKPTATNRATGIVVVGLLL